MERAPGIDHDASSAELLVGKLTTGGAKVRTLTGEWFRGLMKIL